MDFIYKRNGQKAPFCAEKITDAMRKAFVAQKINIGEDILKILTEKVCSKMEEKNKLQVEEIQDIVEDVLTDIGYRQVATAYHDYRMEASKRRHPEQYLRDMFMRLSMSPAVAENFKRENANIDGDTAMGTMLRYGSEASKFFLDNWIPPKNISAAHVDGDIHIHDKDFYLLTETCCQIDLLSLFKDGFSTGHGYLREPNSIASYSALACIAIQSNQNEMHGGQSIPNFDYAMAPGVRKSFKKEFKKAFCQNYCLLSGEQEIQAKKLFTTFIESFGYPDMDENFMAIAEKWRDSSLASEVSSEVSSEMFQKIVFNALSRAYEETDRQVYQAMEAFVGNLNTMNSRAGAQVPFSSVNYGTDTSAEGRMVVKNLLKTTEVGLGDGETLIFPVQIFKVKEGVNSEKTDPNYDLFQQAIKTSALRLFPNFSFLDAPFNLQYYVPGDYNTEVAYMGCRTRVMGNVHDKSREVTCGRGNLSFTSINLPRLGLKTAGNKEAFFNSLDEMIELSVQQLLHRFKIQGEKTVRNYPYLMGQGIWLDSDKLGRDEKIAEILKHGTLSIGFIGLAETLIALTGKHHGEDEESQKLGLEIVSHMRKRCDEFSQKYQLNFTLIATPAEGLAGRFVKLDKQRFGVIEGITDKLYYTNSFHVPVSYPIKAYKKIQIEAPYHAFTNAGHISYVELDGDTCKNLEAFETIIKFMQKSGIGYGSINHPLDRDPVCGYVGVINDCCPRCGRREFESVETEKLEALRKKYLAG